MYGAAVHVRQFCRSVVWDEPPCYLSLSFRIFAHVCVATVPVHCQLYSGGWFHEVGGSKPFEMSQILPHFSSD